MRKGVLTWLPIVLGVAFLLFLAYVQRARAIRGENDFVQLYTGAKLAGTPGLYSRTANLATVKETLGFTMDSVVYTRPPFYAGFLKPLALLPYRAAYAVFSLATLASIVWFVARFSKECDSLPFFAAISIPALAALCGGQDTPFLLLILGVSMQFTRKGRDFAAGLVLSLCAIKFHLFLFLPILWLLKRRWRILAGSASGAAILAGFGLLVCGAGSLRDYLNVLRDPWINPNATGMPNLHGMVAALQGPAWLEITLVAAVGATFLWMSHRTDDYEFLFAASLVAGLLTSFHSGIADDIVLLPALVCVVATCSNPLVRAATALILTPVPYFLSLAGAPYSALFPLSLLVLLGMFCLASAKGLSSASSCRTAWDSSPSRQPAS